MEEGDNVNVEVPEPLTGDTAESDTKLLSVTGGAAVDNGDLSAVETHDRLVEMVTDLRFQNEFLRAQFEGLNDSQSGARVSDEQEEVSVAELREVIDSLNKQLVEEKETRVAAEMAMKHLQVAHSEADAKAEELSVKLHEAQQKLDQEIKEREEKYSDLDLKFNRLHKRAKQRIQDVQKEKDDIEAKLRDANESAERALAQQTVLQQDLERTRQQANEALRAMDVERQQLRSANNKLRDNIEELRHSLEPKERALEALQQSLLEKDQMLEDMQGLLKAAEEKRQASISEISAKHQKSLESLEAQLADAISERSKATETISSLQMIIVEKESEIAEVDAASSGEAARLRAAVETVKGEMAYLKQEHEKERETWETTSQVLRTKLENSERNLIRAEVEVAKMRSQLESEVSAQIQALREKDAELEVAKKEISRLETEFSSYKIRAHALLQKKDAELAASKDSEQVKALEEALKEAEREVSLACSERDKVVQDLHDALANHAKEVADREAALADVRLQIKGLEAKLNSANACNVSDRQTWERNLRNLEEMWQSRYDALKIQNEAASSEDLEKELGDLKLRYKKLKEEHTSFRDLADRMIDEKDSEISKLFDENKNLARSLESSSKDEQNGINNTGLQKQDYYNLSTSAADQQILILARQQAQREEELLQSQRHILALQEEIEELERENRLHSQQEALLKEELRNVDRTQKREGVDLTYLKNVILKLLETGEVEALLPVVGMLLQFSREEIEKCQQAYRSSVDSVPSPSADASGASRSLFSRFSFA